jgi:hypothetical protein
MMQAKQFLSLILGGLAFVANLTFSDAAGADTAASGTTPAIQSDYVLTVTVPGEEPRIAEMTLEDLQRIEAESFETSTIWTTGAQRFTGVPLSDLLAQFNLTAENADLTIEARAINDYMVEIPLSDAVEGGPIVAYLRNGETMSLRGKGPLWLVYPYDSNPAYRTEAIYSRSIWQLDSLVLRPKVE